MMCPECDGAGRDVSRRSRDEFGVWDAPECSECDGEGIAARRRITVELCAMVDDALGDGPSALGEWARLQLLLTLRQGEDPLGWRVTIVSVS